MSKSNFIRRSSSSLIVIIAFILILSFIAHDLIPHHHPSAIYGTGIQAAFHGNDRKWWYLMLLAFIFTTANLKRKWKLSSQAQRDVSFSSSHLRIDISKVFNPIFQALRTGILNPKLCG